jgi:hypothetical protein
MDQEAPDDRADDRARHPVREPAQALRCGVAPDKADHHADQSPVEVAWIDGIVGNREDDSGGDRGLEWDTHVGNDTPPSASDVRRPASGGTGAGHPVSLQRDSRLERHPCPLGGRVPNPGSANWLGRQRTRPAGRQPEGPGRGRRSRRRPSHGVAAAPACRINSAPGCTVSDRSRCASRASPRATTIASRSRAGTCRLVSCSTAWPIPCKASSTSKRYWCNSSAVSASPAACGWARRPSMITAVTFSHRSARRIRPTATARFVSGSKAIAAASTARRASMTKARTPPSVSAPSQTATFDTQAVITLLDSPVPNLGLGGPPRRRRYPSRRRRGEDRCAR